VVFAPFCPQFERTALHRLAEKGTGDTVTMLVTTFGADVNAKDCMGQTPIHYALRFNNQSFMTALANCGADLEQQDVVSCAGCA
jgi:ankyrin repeat protein